MGKDFTVDYFFMRNGQIYASITYKGRIYERHCKLDSEYVPSFKFLNRWWYSKDHKLNFAFGF